MQPIKQFCTRLGPAFYLARPFRLLGESVRDGVLLARVALQIHVGEDVDQLAFCGNQPEVDVLVDEHVLQLVVVDFAMDGFDVLLYCFLDIVDIALRGCDFDLFEGIVGGNVGDVVSVDQAGIFAILPEVSCSLGVRLARKQKKKRTRLPMGRAIDLLGRSCHRPWGVSGDNRESYGPRLCSSGTCYLVALYNLQHDGFAQD